MDVAPSFENVRCRWLIGAARKEGFCHRPGTRTHEFVDIHDGKTHRRLLCNEHMEELEMIHRHNKRRV